MSTNVEAVTRKFIDARIDFKSKSDHAPVRSASAWAPLRRPLFRALWIASLTSSIGTWMHEVGAVWLMTSLTPSPLMVTLMQSGREPADCPAGASCRSDRRPIRSA